jgi:hypothetical protein
MADPSHRPSLRADLERAVLSAVERQPRSRRAYARVLAYATLSGERTHGQQLPEPPDGMDGSAASKARHAIDAACDGVHTAHLKTGMRVRVRSYHDEVDRDGTIQQITLGATAPISVLVAYPAGHTDTDGLEPINPSAYSLTRIITPRSPYPAGPPEAPAPLRDVEHQLGRPGRGWRLPDGGLLTWTVAPRGGPSHDSVYRARGLPDDWPTGGEAIAFTITGEGDLRDAHAGKLPRGEHNRIAGLLLLAFAESHYRRFGWEHRPGFEPFGSEREWRLRPATHATAIAWLLAEGELHRGAGPRTSYRLPAVRRVALIDRHDLGTTWERPAGGPGYDPHHETLGEIPQARREASAEHEGRRAFTAPLRRRADGRLPVRLLFERAAPRCLVIVWGPSVGDDGARNDVVRDGWRQVRTRIPAACGQRVRSALLAEAERLVRAHIARGMPMSAISEWLAGLHPSWLSGPVPELRG